MAAAAHLIVAFLVLFGLGGCSSLFSRPWSGANEFVGSLQCDMPQSEVQAHARRFHGRWVWQSSAPHVLVQKNNTRIFLWFEEDRLQAHRVTWVYPVTNGGARLKNSICTGQEFVELRVVGSTDLAGAVARLNGVEVGTLSSQGEMLLDVPLGIHRLTIEGSGPSSGTLELRYDESSSPYDRLEIDDFMQ